MDNAAKNLVAAVCALLSCMVVAKADYDPMTLYQMLVRADIVVSGEITRVDDSTYELQVDRSFRPSQLPSALTVSRTEHESLASRWMDYVPGQQIVLFAMAGVAIDAPLTLLGATGEGEIPRDDRAIYIPRLAQTDRTPAIFQLAERDVLGYQIDADEFSRAVDGFVRCFKSELIDTASSSVKLVQLCDDTELARLRTDSWLAEHLSAIAQRHIKGD